MRKPVQENHKTQLILMLHFAAVITLYAGMFNGFSGSFILNTRAFCLCTYGFPGVETSTCVMSRSKSVIQLTYLESFGNTHYFISMSLPLHEIIFVIRGGVSKQRQLRPCGSAPLPLIGCFRHSLHLGRESGSRRAFK